MPIEPGCIKICVSAEKVTAVNTHGMNSEGAYSTRAVKERWGTMSSATTKLTAIATDVDGVFTISAASPTSSLKRLAEHPEEDSASDASVEDDFVDYLSGLVPKAKGKAKSHKQNNLGVAKAKPSASGKRTRDDAEGNTSKKRTVSQKDYLMNRHSDFTKASLALSNARITLNKLQTRQAFFSTAPKDLTKVKDALVKASKPISNLADVDDSIILELDGGSTMLARELKRHISELLEASNHNIARLEDLTHISEACKCGPMKKGEPTLIPSAYEVRGAISLAACKGVQVHLPAVELVLSVDMQDHIDRGSIGSAIKIMSGSDTSYLDSMEPTIAMIGQSERMASQELLTSRVIQYCIEKTADDFCFIFAVGVKEHDLFSTSPDMQACMDHCISLNVTAGVVSEEKMKHAYAFFRTGQSKLQEAFATTAGQDMLTKVAKTLLSFSSDRRFDVKVPLLEKLRKQLILISPADSTVPRLKEAVQPLQNLQKEFGDLLANSSERLQTTYHTTLEEIRGAIKGSAEGILAATDAFVMQHLAAHILQLVETALTGIDGSVNYQAAEVDVPDYKYCQ